MLLWVGLQLLSRGAREGVCLFKFFVLHPVWSCGNKALSWKQGGAFPDTESAGASILGSKTLQTSDQHEPIAYEWPDTRCVVIVAEWHRTVTFPWRAICFALLLHLVKKKKSQMASSSSSISGLWSVLLIYLLILSQGQTVVTTSFRRSNGVRQSNFCWFVLSFWDHVR